MSEHRRKNGFQWCDTNRYMVFDQHTGPERIGRGFLVSLEEAFNYLDAFKGWEHRKHIIKVECISAFKLDQLNSND